MFCVASANKKVRNIVYFENLGPPCVEEGDAAKADRSTVRLPLYPYVLLFFATAVKFSTPLGQGGVNSKNFGDFAWLAGVPSDGGSPSSHLDRLVEFNRHYATTR
jgi:hypothetical protein